ncbi:hypothetical protein CA234_11170 [Sphingomonas sp. ABOLE]|nr:hypothetical protein CA234_11170 [Sphingomonas sp. ABOLE]
MTNAEWSEINFSEALWTIPEEHMKRRNSRLGVPVAAGADIVIAENLCWRIGVRPLVAVRFGPADEQPGAQPCADADLSTQKKGKPLAKPSPHDLRRTASTLLHEAGHDTDYLLINH